MQSIRFGFAGVLAVGVALGAPAWSVPAGAQAGAAPVIERVEPTSGPPGTVVHVIGRRFGEGATLQLGSQPLEIVESQANRISGRIGEGMQSGHVAVVAASGTVRGPEFRVTPRPPAPVITSISPTKGPPGTKVVLRGKHFSPRLTGNIVTLGGHPVIVRAATPVELAVTVPEAPRGGPFTVRVEQAGEVASPPFEITAATRVAAVEPPRAGPGAQLKIRGSGFSAAADKNRVYLNGVKLPVKTASESELLVQLPSNVASGKLLVDVQGAGRAYSDEPFVVQRPPRVIDFAPRFGPPGTVVTVRGTNFGKDPQAVEALLGETPLRVRAARDTRLEVEVPSGAQSGKLSIRVAGVGPAWSDATFSVMPALKIVGFRPASGPVGSEVVIEGEGFGDTPARNRVLIGNAQARVVEVGPTRLRVRVQKGASGPIVVQVPGSGEARTSAPFVITVPPQVTSVTPRQGPVGTQLRIQGKGFGTSPAVLKVFLGDVPLTVESVQDDLALVRVPAGARSGRLKVAVPLQGSTELDWEFTVLPAPAEAPGPATAAPSAPPASAAVAAPR